MRPIGQRPQQQPEELPLGQRKLQASPLLRDERALPPQRALYFQVWLRMEGLEKPRKPPRSKEQARTSRIDHLLAVSYDACSSPLRPSRRAKLASANSKLHLVWPCRTSNYKACFCATLSSKVRRVVLTAKLASEMAAIRFCPHDTRSQRAGLPPAADGCANHGSTRRPMTGTLPVKCCATSGFHPCMISTGPVGWWPSAERALGEPARHGQLMVRITRCGDLLSPGT